MKPEILEKAKKVEQRLAAGGTFSIPGWPPLFKPAMQPPKVHAGIEAALALGRTTQALERANAKMKMVGPFSKGGKRTR